MQAVYYIKSFSISIIKYKAKLLYILLKVINISLLIDANCFLVLKSNFATLKKD